jgi:hypothetical protein
VAQEAEHLSGKSKALSSNPSTTKQKQQNELGRGFMSSVVTTKNSSKKDPVCPPCTEGPL